jgi:hypothetical protein
MRVPAQDGAPELVTTLDPRKRELDHIGPVFRRRVNYRQNGDPLTAKSRVNCRFNPR